MPDVTKTTKEVWEDIPGYEGHYQVSNKGRVKSLARLRSPHNTDTTYLTEPFIKEISERADFGYLRVSLCKNNHCKTFNVHRLVAECFVPNPEGKPQINHIDGDPKNNKPENLEWTTQAENVTQQELGQQYGVGPYQISRIVNYKRWTNIN